MGLLDYGDLTDDPRQQGLLSLGLRLMSTPGKFGQAFGQAGLGAMGDMTAAKRGLLDAEYKRAQMADMKAQEKQRLALARKAENDVQLALQKQFRNPQLVAFDQSCQIMRTISELPMRIFGACCTIRNASLLSETACRQVSMS